MSVLAVLRIAGAAGLAIALSAAPSSGQDHADHGAVADPPDRSMPPAPTPSELPPGIPPVTDADRAAAFPQVEGHAVHDRAVHSFVLFDRLEWQAAGGGSGGQWDSSGWIGRDLDRLWFRTEGEGEDGRISGADAHVLYGRAIARWWDVVIGIRQDVRPGPAQTWTAIGVQGLAPYWFEVEATGYVGAAGRTHARLEVKYELLVTNRAILQPLIEVEIYGKDDPERQIGAGLSSADIGVRVRYEVKRELAAYLGVLWSRTFFGTADLARASGQEPNHTRLVAGVRFWR
jgi:copper resistance protein B